MDESLLDTGYQSPDALGLDDDAGMQNYPGDQSAGDFVEHETTPQLMRAVNDILVRQVTMHSSISSLGSESDGMSVDSGDVSSQQSNRPSSVQFGDDFNGGGFGSLVSSASMVNRRSGGAIGVTAQQSGGKQMPDLRKFIFQRSREKRIMSGLQVPPFTRQVFISSFAVGMAIGSVLAIIFKLFTNITSRIF